MKRIIIGLSLTLVGCAIWTVFLTVIFKEAFGELTGWPYIVYVVLMVVGGGFIGRAVSKIQHIYE